MKQYEIYLGNYDAMQTVVVNAHSHKETDSDLFMYKDVKDGEIKIARFKLDTVLGWAIQD